MIAHVMSHGTTCVMMSCAHHAVHAHRQASHPMYTWHLRNLVMDVPFAQAKQYLSKLTASHFSTLNTDLQTRTC